MLVSSHAPVRGHLTPTKEGFQEVIVSSHAPVRGHLQWFLTLRSSPLYVSSHAPVRGHLLFSPTPDMSYPSFKSCPREGASKLLYADSAYGYVSSHAPVRGHLGAVLCISTATYVSSHAPVRGHLKINEEASAGIAFQVMPP